MSKHKLDLHRALNLFNRAQFFDAHEVLEDVWRALPHSHPAKKHLQGLVQLAVALHHASRGNLRGAKSVLARALRNLEGAEVSFPDLDLEKLRDDMAVWRELLAQRHTAPPPPHIEWRDPRR
jgi:predicted metal-dependent hydrolase